MEVKSDDTLDMCVMNSPLGQLLISCNSKNLVSIKINEKFVVIKDELQNNSINNLVIDQLTKYFNGDLKKFDLPLEKSGTEFQQKVWGELSNIPYGQTISYKQLSENLGNSLKIRAAANANGKNPFLIVVPCHRVIGSKGNLVGYAGGLERKRWLLLHEREKILLNGLLF